MGSLVNQKPWVPFLNIRDCSQGFCSLYCPQWCYTIFPPPAPIEFSNENLSPNFSPLVIAIILILASGFLLVSYYAIISKYCVNNSSSGMRENHVPDEELLSNEDPSGLEPWHVANNGLNEALIKSITIFKYKSGHNLLEGTDCSVCLSEFEEDESLRLLPKCNHAFHVVCIDTWLKSHSNCPLCRANIIVSISPPPPPLPPENVDILEIIDTGTIRGEETLQNGEVPNDENKDVVIEIREFKRVRRSVSMDFDYGERLSISDVLLLNQDYSLRNDGVGSSKGKISEMIKLSSRGEELGCDNISVSMKRSLSSERFPFSRRGKEHIFMIPL